MTAQRHDRTPAARTPLPRRVDRARVPGKPVTRGTEFDVERWLERYRAAHAGDAATDELAGVPFN